MAEIEEIVTFEARVEALRKQQELQTLKASVMRVYAHHTALSTLFQQRYVALHPEVAKLHFSHGETIIYEEWIHFDSREGVVYHRRWINSVDADEPVQTYRLTIDELFAEVK